MKTYKEVVHETALSVDWWEMKVSAKAKKDAAVVAKKLKSLDNLTAALDVVFVDHQFNTLRGKSNHRKMIKAHLIKQGILKPTEANNYFLSENDLDEKSDYELYHSSFTGAINAAEAFALKKKYTIDKEEWAQEIGMGPRKPSEGKTNRYSLTLFKNGKEQKKMLQIQVYNRGNNVGNNFELNAYIS